MDFIKNIKEKHHTSVQKDWERRAKEAIGLLDFQGKLYISYEGVPLLLLQETFTSKEILQNLEIVRNNFIIAKTQESC